MGTVEAAQKYYRQLDHNMREVFWRQARLEDAAVLAELVNYAGEGLPLYLWSRLAEKDETPWEVGRKRAARETGSFSYRNATIIEHSGRSVGSLIGYKIPEQPEPVSDEMPPMFVPLHELENLAPGTWYVNVLAVLPEYRGQGLGSELLLVAEKTGLGLGARGMSVIVSDANVGARQLYERHGYHEAERRPMVKEDWVNSGKQWVLLTKLL